MSNELNIDKLNIEVSASSSDATGQVDKLTASLNKILAIANKFTSVNNISNKFDDIGNKAEKSTSRFQKMASSLGGAVKGFGKMALGLGAAGIAFRIITKALLTCYDESNNYIEALNLFHVALGDTAEAALDFAESVEKAMGIDSKEWMEYQGSFNMLAKGFGVASDSAQIMSQNLTQLAYDYSSLMNVPVQESFEKLNSAMTGQIKGLKEYGNDVSVAALKQTALQYGIKGSISALDRSTQAFLRYQTIMKNAADVGVFNDMARTINTPANALRILTAQFTQLKRAVGNIASVFATKLVPFVQIFVQLCTKAANALANLFGFSLPEIDYSGLSYGADDADDLASGLDNAASSAKKAKKALMGFDELNILPSNKESDSGSGSTTGFEFNTDDLLTYNFLEGLENETAKTLDRIQAKLANIFGPLVENASIAFDGLKTIFVEAWDNGGSYFATNLVSFVGKIGELAGLINTNFIQPVLGWFSEDLAPVIGGVFGYLLQKLGEILDAFNDFLDFLIDNEGVLSGGALAEATSKFFGDILSIVLDTIGDLVDSFLSVDWFKLLCDIGSACVDGICAGLEFLTDFVVTIIEEMVKGVTDFLGITGYSTKFEDIGLAITLGVSKGIETLAECIAQPFIDAWNLATDIWGVVTEWFGSTIIQPLSSAFGSFGTSIQKTFSRTWTNIKNKASETWNDVLGIFSKEGKIFSGLKEGIASVFKTIVNSLISGINRVISKPFNTINSLLNNIRSIEVLGISPFKGLWRYNPLSVPQIPKLATGGMPATGQMFIAREAGPELVGKIGNQSAVVNNNQIISGIEAAVYRAMMAVGGGGEKSITIHITTELDGEVVAKKVYKHHNQTVLQTGESPLVY